MRRRVEFLSDRDKKFILDNPNVPDSVLCGQLNVSETKLAKTRRSLKKLKEEELEKLKMIEASKNSVEFFNDMWRVNSWSSYKSNYYY